jgi:excisionase family DNA binding protein
MKRLLTPEQLAEWLSVKVSTVYQWTHTGYVPFVKVGRLVRFNQDDVERWLKKRSHKGRPSNRRSMSNWELGS